MRSFESDAQPGVIPSPHAPVDLGRVDLSIVPNVRTDGFAAKRVFDLALAMIVLIVVWPLLILLWATVRITSKGPAIYRSQRVGRHGQEFQMWKFRSMAADAPQLATHLLENPDDLLTPIGGLLRKTSLDELPQLVNVLRGDMSIVGPRPALFNQFDLVELRRELGVDAVSPGITGLAQVRGRDTLSIPEKVALDREYIERRSLALDVRLLLETVRSVFVADGISH